MTAKTFLENLALFPFRMAWDICVILLTILFVIIAFGLLLAGGWWGVIAVIALVSWRPLLLLLLLLPFLPLADLKNPWPRIPVVEKRTSKAAEEAEMNWLWNQLRLYRDRLEPEPDKWAASDKLTVAMNRARAAGDIKTLRKIAQNPEGFILRLRVGTAEDAPG